MRKVSKKNKKHKACIYLRKSSEEKVEAPGKILRSLLEAVDGFQTKSLAERVRRGNEAMLKQGINPYRSSSIRINQYRCIQGKKNRHTATDNLVVDLLEAVQKYEKTVRSELIKRGRQRNHQKA